MLKEKETWIDEDYSKLALKEHIFDKIEKTLTESDMDKIEKIQLDNNIREYTRQRLMWQIEDLRNIKLETIPSVLVDIAREIKALMKILLNYDKLRAEKMEMG